LEHDFKNLGKKGKGTEKQNPVREDDLTRKKRVINLADRVGSISNHHTNTQQGEEVLTPLARRSEGQKTLSVLKNKADKQVKKGGGRLGKPTGHADQIEPKKF